MTAWGIVPLHRREDLPNVVANARRQRARFDLCIVENGDAIGACEALGFAPSLLLTSERHQSMARNVALEEIRRRGGGFFFAMDADDWYGPGYLEELLANARRADVVGKRRHLVLLSDGLHLFDARGASKPTEWLHGACLAGRSEDAAEFPMVAVGEDHAWCRTMRARGATMLATSARNYVYVRTGTAHTWRASDVILRKHLGSSFRLGSGHPVYLHGPSDAEVFAALLRPNGRSDHHGRKKKNGEVEDRGSELVVCRRAQLHFTDDV